MARLLVPVPPLTVSLPGRTLRVLAVLLTVTVLALSAVLTLTVVSAFVDRTVTLSLPVPALRLNVLKLLAVTVWTMPPAVGVAVRVVVAGGPTAALMSKVVAAALAASRYSTVLVPAPP